MHFFLRGFHVSLTNQQVCDLCDYSDTETTATSFQGAVAEKQRGICPHQFGLLRRVKYVCNFEDTFSNVAGSGRVVRSQSLRFVQKSKKEILSLKTACTYQMSTQTYGC